MLELGFEPVANTPAEFTKIIQTEIPKWKRAIKASGATAE